MPETFDVVFRGGGIKGIAFVGALDRLTADKHTTRRLIGTSAGAIFSTAWAAGYSPAEMKKRVTERIDGKLVFACFLEDAFRPPQVAPLVWKPLAGSADAVVKQAAKRFNKVKQERSEGWGGKSLGLLFGGATADDAAFREWMSDLLRAKDVDPKTSLKDFHALMNKSRPQQLTLIAADITGQQVLVLNERTAPDLPIIEAVRMSMSIPFVWKEVVWRANWGKYRGRDITDHQIVDGGLLSNFPMRYILDPYFEKESCEIGPPPGGGKAWPVGLLLDGTKPAPDLPLGRESDQMLENVPAVRLGSKILDTMLDAWDKDALRQHVPEGKADHYICRIGTKGIGALDFDMTDERVAAVVNSGHCAMAEFLERRK